MPTASLLRRVATLRYASGVNVDFGDVASAIHRVHGLIPRRGLTVRNGEWLFVAR
jgi:hypothetical protein